MNLYRGRVGWILTVAFMTAVPAGAQTPSRLAGSVADATGLPLTSVAITLRGPVDRSASTDAAGRFEIQNLPVGQYDLVASLPGFAPVRRVLHITPGENADLSLTLTVQFMEQALVTASRTGEADVQTTPMAVSVLTGTDVTRLNDRTVEHVAGQVPSVTFSQNTGFAQLTIRGIGTNAVFAGSDPSSAVYVDGVYFARPAMVLGDFLDLDRIEVLRGPQGTLYGRNAVGGAVNLITKPPTDDFEASARILAGDGSMFRAEARVSGPLVRGKVMGSGSLIRGLRRGFVTDVDHPDHPLGAEDVWAARGQLRVVFNRSTELLASADVTHQDPTPMGYPKVLAVKPGFVVNNPEDLHEVRTSVAAESRNLQYGAHARLTVALTPATSLTSLSAYRKLDYDLVVDGDITELDLTVSHPHETQHQLSEELTLSHQDPKLTWIAGLFLFGEVDRQPTHVRLGGPQLENLLNPHVEAGTEALFGQATIGLTPSVSMTAGLRYSHERKTINNAGQLSTLETPVTVLTGSAYSYTDRISHTAWTPKIGLEVRPHARSLAYVSATRGFKSGGFNLTSQQPGRGFAPEWAWSYEAGFKTALARTSVNIAGFHTDYTDLQVQTAILPGVIDISNAAEATIRGVEVEARTLVARAVQAGGHLAWLDTRYDQYVATGVGGVTGDVAGNRLNNAPLWSGRIFLEWMPDLSQTHMLSLRADSTWQTTVYFTPFNDDIQRQGAYGLLNLSGEFGPKQGRWTIGAYARNLTNEDFITGTFSSPPPAIGGRPGEPRQMGIQFSVRR